MNYPIELQDKFRSTEGIAQYKRQTYLAGAVKAPKVVSVRILLKLVITCWVAAKAGNNLQC